MPKNEKKSDRSNINVGFLLLFILRHKFYTQNL